jgi:hypothetical protein
MVESAPIDVPLIAIDFFLLSLCQNHPISIVRSAAKEPHDKPSGASEGIFFFV